MVPASEVRGLQEVAVAAQCYPKRNDVRRFWRLAFIANFWMGVVRWTHRWHSKGDTI